MIEALTNGQLFSALTYNPLLFVALLLLVAWLGLSIAGLILGKPHQLVLDTGDARKFWIAFGIAVLLNWIYLIIFDPA